MLRDLKHFSLVLKVPLAPQQHQAHLLSLMVMMLILRLGYFVTCLWQMHLT
jgi:hypothetical protein